MLSRLGFPAVGRHGRFVTAIGIDAMGSGVWMPVSMLYFLAVTPLDLVQVGLALTLGSVFTLPLSLVVGQVVDRYGAKRILQVGNILQAVGFAAYPFAHTVPTVAAVIDVASVGRTAFWGSFSPMVAAISEPGERERWFGFLGALRNSGFAVGGLVAAGVITIGTRPVYTAVVLVNAASYLASFVLMSGVAATERRTPSRQGGGWREVLGDRGYRWLVGCNFAYAMTEMSLIVVMPVYIVRMLHLPGWLSGSVFVINTVMIGVGQGLIVNRMTGAVRTRIVTLAAGVTAASFALMYAAGLASKPVAIGVVLVAAVVYTIGEMVAGPVLSALATESPPEHLRGRFLAVYQLSWNLSGVVAPVLYAWLLDRGALSAWSGLAAMALLGAACCVPMRRLLPLAGRRVTNTPQTAPTSEPVEI